MTNKERSKIFLDAQSGFIEPTFFIADLARTLDEAEKRGFMAAAEICANHTDPAFKVMAEKIRKVAGGLYD